MKRPGQTEREPTQRIRRGTDGRREGQRTKSARPKKDTAPRYQPRAIILKKKKMVSLSTPLQSSEVRRKFQRKRDMLHFIRERDYPLTNK